MMSLIYEAKRYKLIEKYPILDMFIGTDNGKAR
jgi:hypothetical protein